ncbi:2,3-bisphosphoglycerate-independent phosphoglycerate mutase [Candidatus Neomarinimicrobiota bacterium]
MKKKFVLLILDGFGLRDEEEGNAAKIADTPTLDRLQRDYPMIPLKTSGAAVGLPDGVMGNSEVGHMNMGAGRIVRQNLVRINAAISSGEFFKLTALQKLINHVKSTGGILHLLGLCSDGGVHSHIDHFAALLKAAKDAGLADVAVHAITDGRDTAPNAGIKYIARLEELIQEAGIGRITSISGRYYAMDRDNRWERVERAYKLYMHGEGTNYTTAQEAIEDSYANDVGDEFVLPCTIGAGAVIRSGDGLLSVNFRSDRMRQLVRAFTVDGFEEFPTVEHDFQVVSMTQYDETFTVPVMFPPENLENGMSVILSKQGYSQIRMAETEKYAHVTYFFNGGVEEPYPGEERVLVPSPKVATYDLKPEMSAREVTAKAVTAIRSGNYDAIIMNLANPDMVGHTGKLPAALAAMRTIDSCVSDIWQAIRDMDGALFLTADHGNIEMMIDPETGNAHTAHTTLDVPFIMAIDDAAYSLDGTGKLADIAPTILDYLEIDKPEEMSGESKLLVRQVHAS